jgi:hypothetical protein
MESSFVAQSSLSFLDDYPKTRKAEKPAEIAKKVEEKISQPEVLKKVVSASKQTPSSPQKESPFGLSKMTLIGGGIGAAVLLAFLSK